MILIVELFEKLLQRSGSTVVLNGGRMGVRQSPCCDYGKSRLLCCYPKARFYFFFTLRSRMASTTTFGWTIEYMYFLVT